MIVMKSLKSYGMLEENLIPSKEEMNYNFVIANNTGVFKWGFEKKTLDVNGEI